MYIGNLVLLILNLPLWGFRQYSPSAQYLLMGLILLLCLVGTYSVNNSLLDIYLLIGMGGVGYILRKLKFDMAPLILALVLGPMMEKTLSQSLFMARGDVGSIILRPISLALYSVAVAVIFLPYLYRLAAKKSNGRRK